MSEPKQQPSIGRMVHYVNDDGAHLPAAIVEPEHHSYEPDPIGGVDMHWVKQGLFVMTMNGPFTVYAAESTEPYPGMWHWPEYVPAQ